MKFACATLPKPSVAVQLTCVVPGLKRLPDEGLHSITGLAVLSSVAVTLALKSTTAPVVSCVVTLTLGGTVRTGGVRSPARGWQDSSECHSTWAPEGDGLNQGVNEAQGTVATTPRHVREV